MTYIKKDHYEFENKREADNLIQDMKQNISKYCTKGADHTLEKYSAQILDSLEKYSKFELMKYIKIKPAVDNDMKAKIIREYLDPEKRKTYKDIDRAKILAEKAVKYMPKSEISHIQECKDSIAQCTTYSELRTQMTKNEVKNNKADRPLRL
jgi:hypothetical protein